MLPAVVMRRPGTAFLPRVSHQEVVRDPKDQNVDEERNHEHHHGQFDPRVLERGQDKVFHVVPDVELDEQRRYQLNDRHQADVDPRLVQPRFGRPVLAKVDCVPLFLAR